jgi:hypothetical protein
VIVAVENVDPTANLLSWRRKLRLLLVIIDSWPIVMGGGNDAGGVQVYAQTGQDYGMKLLWTFILLSHPFLLPGNGGTARRGFRSRARQADI